VNRDETGTWRGSDGTPLGRVVFTDAATGQEMPDGPLPANRTYAARVVVDPPTAKDPIDDAPNRKARRAEAARARRRR
jgi:hypothetical protein